MTRLSIITATFNSAPHIQRCLSSVSKVLQGIDYEHIIIDGISTDGTLEYITYYASLYENVVVCNQPPNGIYSALNLGVNLCSGDYVMFLHSDDVLLDDFRYILENELVSDVCFCGVEIFYKNGIYRKYMPYHFPSKLMYSIYPPPHTGMVLKSSVLKNFKFDLKYEIASDYKQLLELLDDSRFTKTYLKVCVVLMASGGASTKLKNTRKIFLEECSILSEKGFFLKNSIVIAKKISKIFSFRYRIF
jgi:glycosyltransferase